MTSLLCGLDEVTRGHNFDSRLRDNWRGLHGRKTLYWMCKQNISANMLQRVPVISHHKREASNHCRWSRDLQRHHLVAGRASPVPVEVVKQHQQRVEVPGGKTLPLGVRPRAVPVDGQAQPQPQAQPQFQPQPDSTLERPRPTDSPAVEPAAGGIPETIMLNIISMLSPPSDESPANTDTAKGWQEDRKDFRSSSAEDPEFETLDTKNNRVAMGGSSAL